MKNFEIGVRNVGDSNERENKSCFGVVGVDFQVWGRFGVGAYPSYKP